MPERVPPTAPFPYEARLEFSIDEIALAGKTFIAVGYGDTAEEAASRCNEAMVALQEQEWGSGGG